VSVATRMSSSLRSMFADYLLHWPLVDFRETSGNGLAARVAFECRAARLQDGGGTSGRRYTATMNGVRKKNMPSVLRVDRMFFGGRLERVKSRTGLVFFLHIRSRFDLGGGPTKTNWFYTRSRTRRIQLTYTQSPLSRFLCAVTPVEPSHRFWREAPDAGAPAFYKPYRKLSAGFDLLYEQSCRRSTRSNSRTGNPAILKNPLGGGALPSYLF